MSRPSNLPTGDSSASTRNPVSANASENSPTDLAHFRPRHAKGDWPAALAYAQQSLGAALVPTATLSPQDEPTFVTRPFDESFTLDESLITRTDFSNQALEATKSALREVTT